MSAKLVTPTWSHDHPTRQKVIKKYIFLGYTHLRSKKPRSLFSSQGTQSRQRAWFDFYLLFSAITVKFPCSSTMADGTVDNKVNTVTIKVPPLFKHAPETWFVHLEHNSTLSSLKPAPPSFIGAFLLYPPKSPPSWRTWSETLEKNLIKKSRIV